MATSPDGFKAELDSLTEIGSHQQLLAMMSAWYIRNKRLNNFQAEAGESSCLFALLLKHPEISGRSLYDAGGWTTDL